MTEQTREILTALDLSDAAGIYGQLDYSDQWRTLECDLCKNPAVVVAKYAPMDYDENCYTSTDEYFCADHAHENVAALGYREDLDPEDGIHITLSGWWKHYNQQVAA
ncbi:hypothetical protein [Prescottella agglutinans]|uniref:Phage protein n=1 Tax=Prescottella agglutinans TaxID=1644129 RepID=A0ABT6MF12_9NOCA|nr:hypothetical protein [Prescottella agglutinans]MDH6282893.1 hypothetical protein [Prescottella agglutinans]